MQNLKEVYYIFQEIANTSGRNDKEKLIKDNKDNQLFKDIIQFVYDDFIVTGISDKKLNKSIKNVLSNYSITDIYELFEYLKSHNTGTDIDIFLIQRFINRFGDIELQEFIKQIVTKSLKIGSTATTFNKVFGEGFIKQFNCMLAEKYWDYEDKFNEEFIITEKLDGMRILAIKKDNNLNLFSRQGQILNGFEQIEEELSLLPNGVYDGELILRNDNNLNSADLYRETIKVARKDGIKKDIVFNMFDYINNIEDFKNGIHKVKCSDRKNKLHEVLANQGLEYIKEVEILYTGNDKEQIIKWLDRLTAEGKEGIMINVSSGYYQCKRTKEILKVKKFNEADIYIVDLEIGTGKNKDKLGNIIIQFKHNDKIHECKCGSGFSDEERILYWNNPELIKGKIATIGYFEVSQNQDGGFGLRFPTWKGIIRDDKSEISMY